MILAVVQLDLEFWRMVRLLIALLQPLMVLLLIAGLVLATGHLLTMIGTRWGDHRASSKAMFFSVAMHLLMVGSLIALIPEYHPLELLNLASQELDPIKVTVPKGNSQDPNDINDENPSFDPSSTTFGDAPGASPVEMERMASALKMTEQPLPLEKQPDSAPFMPALVKDATPQPEPISQTPEQVVPEPVTAERMTPQAGPEVEPVPLPQQSQAGEGKLSPIERSALPVSPVEKSQAMLRPDTGSSDRFVAEMARDRQSSEALAVPTEDSPFAKPNALMTSRADTPAPLAPTPQMLGQPVPKEFPETPNPQVGRMESRPTAPASDIAGIGRLRARTPDGIATSPLPTRTPGTADRSMASAMPVEQPELSRVPNPFQPKMGGDRVPSAYSLRADEERGKAVMKFGGSKETEDAVDRSLHWIASVQDPQGYWHAGDYDPATVASQAAEDRRPDVGITSLAVLCFLGKLNTVDQGEYSPAVNRALRWIVSQQRTKQWGEGWGSTPGYLGGAASEYEAMYCHAMATFALAESYAVSRNSPDAQWLRRPLQQAVSFILDTQNVDGGWRYVKGQREGDMSIFGWQLMALKSAQAAGIEVDERRLNRMRGFLLERRIGSSGGLAGFRPREAAGASTAAETLYCRQMLGIATDPLATQDAVRTIVSNLPRRSTLNYYYWYYGTLALYQHGGPEWEQWNTAVRNMLVAEQRRSGPMTGSWDPHDVWGGYGSRMYSTAIATLSLEVYYRYLPVDRLNEVAP